MVKYSKQWPAGLAQAARTLQKLLERDKLQCLFCENSAAMAMVSAFANPSGSKQQQHFLCGVCYNCAVDAYLVDDTGGAIDKRDEDTPVLDLGF